MELPTQQEARVMSISEFDHRVYEVTKTRQLSIEEQAFVKEIMRRQASKLTTRNYRAKQKKVLADLQQKIAGVENAFDISCNMCFALSKDNFELQAKLHTLSMNYYSLFHGEGDSVTLPIDLIRYSEPPVPYMPEEEDACTLSSL